MKKGFTLIEMLVVVLIIGILAGIALPQYTNAVRKARVAEAKITLRALVDATDRYILEHGDSDWDSLEDLDVQVETDTKNWTFELDECTGNNGTRGCSVSASPKTGEDFYISYSSVNYDVYPGKFTCYANGTEAHKICKSLGAQQINDTNEYLF